MRQQAFGSGRGAPASAEDDAGRGVYPVSGGQRKGSGKTARGSIAHAIGAEHSSSSSDEETSPARLRTTYHIPEVFNASKHMYKLIIEPSVPSTRLNMKFPYIVHFQHVFCLGIMFMSSLDELTRNPHYFVMFFFPGRPSVDLRLHGAPARAHPQDDEEDEDLHSNVVLSTPTYT